MFIANSPMRRFLVPRKRGSAARNFMVSSSTLSPSHRALKKRLTDTPLCRQLANGTGSASSVIRKSVVIGPSIRSERIGLSWMAMNLDPISHEDGSTSVITAKQHGCPAFEIWIVLLISVYHAHRTKPCVRAFFVPHPG